MIIGNKKVKEIIITDKREGLIASITDDDIVADKEYTVNLLEEQRKE